MVSFEEIKKALKNFHPNRLEDDGSTRGAVLIPIFEKNDELFVLFTKRTDDLPTHKGQISFPGGKIEEKDKSMLDCAIREAGEEVGICSSAIELLGELNQTKTYGSNFLLSVFVGKIANPFKLIINEDEVDEIIEVPMELFFDENLWEKKTFTEKNEELSTWFFTYQNYTIWGATAEITREFIDIIQKSY